MKNSQKRFSALGDSANRVGVVPVIRRAGIDSVALIRARSGMGVCLCSRWGGIYKGNIKKVMLPFCRISCTAVIGFGKHSGNGVF